MFFVFLKNSYNYILYLIFYDIFDSTQFQVNLNRNYIFKLNYAFFEMKFYSFEIFNIIF